MPPKYPRVAAEEREREERERKEREREERERRERGERERERERERDTGVPAKSVMHSRTSSFSAAVGKLLFRRGLGIRG